MTSRLTEIMRLADRLRDYAPKYFQCGYQDDLLKTANNLEQMVELIRMQHKAIKQREFNGYAYSSADKEALAAFERFDRGEG